MAIQNTTKSAKSVRDLLMQSIFVAVIAVIQFKTDIRLTQQFIDKITILKLEANKENPTKLKANCSWTLNNTKKVLKTQ